MARYKQKIWTEEEAQRVIEKRFRKYFEKNSFATEEFLLLDLGYVPISGFLRISQKVLDNLILEGLVAREGPEQDRIIKQK